MGRVAVLFIAAATLSFVSAHPLLRLTKGALERCSSTQSCLAGQTCCSTGMDDYGCCDGVNAVCCSDGEHCCQEGETCDLSEGVCRKLPSKKTTILTKVTSATSNSTSCSCSDSETCCSDDGVSSMCCPLANAVCCSSYTCCPGGTTCGGDGHCYRKSTGNVAATATNTKKVSGANNAQSITCPGGDYACPDSTKCCLQDVSTGTYGCCPYEYGVCCSGTTCCPENTQCSLTGCTSKTGAHYILKKFTSSKRLQ